MSLFEAVFELLLISWEEIHIIKGSNCKCRPYKKQKMLRLQHIVCVLSVFFVGYLTTYAIDLPASLGWRGLQTELKKSDSKMNYGFMFKFAEVLYT